MTGLEWFFVVAILVASIGRILTIQNWTYITPVDTDEKGMFNKNQIAKTIPMILGSGLTLLTSLIFIIYVIMKIYPLRSISIPFKFILISLGFVGFGYDFFLSYITMDHEDCSANTSVGHSGCETDTENKKNTGIIVSHVATLIRLIIVFYVSNQFDIVQQIAGKRR